MCAYVAILYNHRTSVFLSCSYYHAAMCGKLGLGDVFANDLALDDDSGVTVRRDRHIAGCGYSRSILDRHTVSSFELEAADGVIRGCFIHSASRLVHSKRSSLNRRSINDNVAIFSGYRYITILGQDWLLDAYRRRAGIASDSNCHVLGCNSLHRTSTKRHGFSAVMRISANWIRQDLGHYSAPVNRANRDGHTIVVHHDTIRRVNRNNRSVGECRHTVFASRRASSRRCFFNAVFYVRGAISSWGNGNGFCRLYSRTITIRNIRHVSADSRIRVDIDVACRGTHIFVRRGADCRVLGDATSCL